MNTKLSEKFEEAERIRQRLLNDLKDFSDEVLNTRPADGGWSVVQVIHHLILSEQNTVGYLRKKSLGLGTARKTGLSAFLRIKLTQLWLATPFLKRKAPAIIAKVPDYATFADTAALWDTTRANLKALLYELPDSAAERELFRHPFAGMFNLYQMLDFITAHLSHHVRQINQALPR